MGPIAALKTVLIKKYATFSGRASRSEYWWVVAFNFLFTWALFYLLLTAVAAAHTPVPPKNFVVSNLEILLAGVGLCWLALILPSIAVTVRRLHDRNLSGWWILGYLILSTLLIIIPLLGGAIINLVLSIIAIVIMATKGDPGPNRFGQDPLTPDATSDVFA